MIQVANKPFDEVDFKWLVCCVFGAWRQKYIYSCEYITETRNLCEFRKNMIQVANRPFDEVDFNWPICMTFGTK